jgi:hypothetical protein
MARLHCGGSRDAGMKEPALTLENFDRLAKAMMERHQVDYTKAREMLSSLDLGLVCGEDVASSVALQAAVLTSINTGKRAFRNGVTVQMPNAAPLLLPWPGASTLNAAAAELGATVVTGLVESDHRITFANTQGSAGGLRVVCDGWRGGVIPARNDTQFRPGADFALGGILGGGIAVARAFLSAAGISNRDVTEPAGFSLWRPDVQWLSAEAKGPPIKILPSKLWLLGLGHLGQAYAWTIGLLGCPGQKAIKLYLQDCDMSEAGNWSAGLLCNEDNIGDLKTRICSQWLESRRFDTRIVERLFDEHTSRVGDEPRIALCGFDNPESRRSLESAGFDLIVEAALGADVDRFDRIVLHTFPDAFEKAAEIWSQTPEPAKGSLRPDMFGVQEETCGILFDDLTGKAISSSFTGACASAFVIGEVLKALHGGKRCEFLTVHIRNLDEIRVALREE